jgi:phosphatidylinositol alpha-1,6-mannosyltransferase
MTIVKGARSSVDQSARLRLLYVSPPTGALGGIETYSRDLAAAMADAGHEVEIVETGRPASTSLDLRNYLPPAELRQRYYLWRRTDYEDVRYQTSLYRRTRAVARAFRPHVVHALHVHPCGAVLGVDAPVVVTAHGLEVSPIPPVISSIGHAACVHANSQFTAGLVRERLNYTGPLQVLSWGIRGNGRTVADPEFDLVTVGRVVRRKNIDTVLKAIALVDPTLRYAVAGDGPELGPLRELAASLNLKHVRFLGPISNAERDAVLHTSRLFVMCPRFEADDVEGLGLVYYEALAAGLPLLGARSGGAPEAIGDAGLLVTDPVDVSAVADALRTALDPTMRARLLDCVVRRQHTASWGNFVKSFEQFYRKIAAGKAARCHEASTAS